MHDRAERAGRELGLKPMMNDTDAEYWLNDFAGLLERAAPLATPVDRSAQDGCLDRLQFLSDQFDDPAIKTAADDLWGSIANAPMPPTSEHISTIRKRFRVLKEAILTRTRGAAE